LPRHRTEAFKALPGDSHIGHHRLRAQDRCALMMALDRLAGREAVLPGEADNAKSSASCPHGAGFNRGAWNCRIDAGASG